MECVLLANYALTVPTAQLLNGSDPTPATLQLAHLPEGLVDQHGLALRHEVAWNWVAS